MVMTWALNRSAILLVLGECFVAGCSDATPADPDGAPPDIAQQADTSTARDAHEAATEASAEDASVGEDRSVGEDSSASDGGCACSTFDSGIPQIPRAGVVAMSCYCDMPWAGFGWSATPCMTYDDALACKSGSRGAMITYTNCDIVTFNYGDNGVDERHYDARTHLFVGARRGVDHSVACGAEMVITIQAGVLPAADCQIAKVEPLCSDAGAGDAKADGILDVTSDADANDAATDASDDLAEGAADTTGQ